MKVHRQKELSKSNIKWRDAAAVVLLRNEIYKYIEQWKKVNQDLYVTER
jgi:hypothetical protein